MKRKDLIKKIQAQGCTLVRHGGAHDWYQNTATKISQPVPRHREINENLARHILKLLGKKKT
jgi:mRNA interferase HicA